MRPPAARRSATDCSTSDHQPPPSLLLRRGRSGIHGSGVYARIAIPESHPIVQYEGERITKAESERREAARLERIRQGRDSSTFIFDLNKRYDLDGRTGGNISRFINHSCDPNCRAELDRGRIWIVAMSDIAPGMEITFDYGFPFKDWSSNPCRCGTPKCAGFIVSREQRWRLRIARRGR